MGATEIAQLLLDAGADVAAIDVEGLTGGWFKAPHTDTFRVLFAFSCLFLPVPHYGNQVLCGTDALAWQLSV